MFGKCVKKKDRNMRIDDNYISFKCDITLLNYLKFLMSFFKVTYFTQNTKSICIQMFSLHKAHYICIIHAHIGNITIALFMEQLVAITIPQCMQTKNHHVL